jgi:Ca2+-transporting ATPase
MAGHAAEFGAMSDEEAPAKADGIGVIARASPEHKVRLVDVPRKQSKDDQESAFSADT